MRKLELLAPAKNLECGIAAIDHGADAVYIGAPRFGARAAAGNSVDDIRALCKYAHQFAAKVYVTVNTIIYDNELDDTFQLLKELQQAGVDAVLIQDMAVVNSARCNLHAALHNLHSALNFHASTQTDNRTADKVKWLHSLGFSRVVLARELSVDEIAEIHRQVPDVELEVFVHGALCVSYSGLCYASQHCFGRSANRGACAQFCRMKFDLLDADGQVLEHERYLLSLKDLNQSAHLGELIEAGAVSFKIEGRLKDVAYVKNVTAAYSELLNQYIALHPKEYQRASLGRCTYTFKPDLRKTFNRGYTTYFLHGRQPDIASFDTPKAMGEFVGTVKEIRGKSFNVAGIASFSNGDGLCFINSRRELEGFRVNRVEGNRLFPLNMPPGLRPGLRLYRNNDQEMEHLLAKPSAERKIPVKMSLCATADGFALQTQPLLPHPSPLASHLSPLTSHPSPLTSHPSPLTSEASIPAEHQQAQKDQRENIIRQLTKLGGTPYECAEVGIPEGFNYFIPSSLLSELRRKAVAQLKDSLGFTATIPDEHPTSAVARSAMPLGSSKNSTLPTYPLPYLYNVSNHLAHKFYEQQGVQVGDAFELSASHTSPLIMQCRHCLRYALGRCVKHGGRKPEWKEPLSLRLGDGRKFRLQFDCRQCQMNIYADE